MSRYGHQHFRTVCPECETVILECRCIGPKDTTYELCSECQSKPEIYYTKHNYEDGQFMAIDVGQVWRNRFSGRKCRVIVDCAFLIGAIEPDCVVLENDISSNPLVLTLKTFRRVFEYHAEDNER